ncbi:MAG: 50S ribosomal protein L25 [Chlamydiia bacterium]|nr:50S ribosomal protein L25 [Chlamydiia bacterium]MCH9618863.1 50S ribosomal protein L25 [Chlamydiia bacterium]MCH9624536.1 50S ribosomal protein L25 [Chlamydiia bacterium]
MDITLEERESGKGIKLVRREGFIPAVVYDKTGKSVSVKVDKKVFDTHMRHLEEGSLATARFKLTLGKETFTAFVKDITYHRTTYIIQHIDFMRVNESDVVTLNVPVTLKGEDACIGITQGGKLKKVKRSVKASCIVKEMPEHFMVDVTQLPLGGQIRVSDLTIASSMKLRIHEKQVLVSVTK